MKRLDSRLGEVIRCARARRRLTQVALARRCGISRRHIAGIEGGANFSVAVLVAMAGELPEIAALIAAFITASAASAEEARPKPL